MTIKLKDIYLFKGINLVQINMIIDNSRRKSFKKGDIIIKQGEITDNHAYIIQEGTVGVFINNKNIAELTEGTVFGEIALVTTEVRTATIIAKTNITLLRINKELLFDIIRNFENGIEIRKIMIKRIKENAEY